MPESIEDRLDRLKAIGIIKDYISYPVKSVDRVEENQVPEKNWQIWGPEQTAYPHTSGYNETFDAHDLLRVLPVLEGLV